MIQSLQLGIHLFWYMSIAVHSGYTFGTGTVENTKTFSAFYNAIFGTSQ